MTPPSRVQCNCHFSSAISVSLDAKFAKFGWNQWSSFAKMDVQYFFCIWLVNVYTRSRNWGLGAFESQCFSSGPKTPKIASVIGDLDTHHMCMVLWAQMSLPPIGIWTGSSIFAGFKVVINRPTDRRRHSVCCVHAMRPRVVIV